jgi:hypothetical protein
MRYIRNSLEWCRFGEEPFEDAEIPGFAASFVQRAAGKFTMPEARANLCDVCSNIPVKWLLKSPDNGYTLASHEEMQESGKSCGFCELILSCLNDGETWLPIKTEIYLSPEVMHLDVRVEGGGYERQFKIWTDPASEAANMGVEAALPALPKIGSELYFHILKEWL